jgi:hypothetical protein
MSKVRSDICAKLEIAEREKEILEQEFKSSSSENVSTNLQLVAMGDKIKKLELKRDSYAIVLHDMEEEYKVTWSDLLIGIYLNVNL